MSIFIQFRKELDATLVRSCWTLISQLAEAEAAAQEQKDATK